MRCPSVDDSVKQNHVKANEHRYIQQIDPDGGIGLEDALVYAAAKIAGYSSCQKQYDTQDAAFFTYGADCFVFVFFVDNV